MTTLDSGRVIRYQCVDYSARSTGASFPSSASATCSTTSTKRRCHTLPSSASRKTSTCTGPITAGLAQSSTLDGKHGAIVLTCANDRLAWAIPSNLLMQRSPPAYYLSFNIFMWGALLMCQAASKNFATLAALRGESRPAAYRFGPDGSAFGCHGSDCGSREPLFAQER